MGQFITYNLTYCKGNKEDTVYIEILAFVH